MLSAKSDVQVDTSEVRVTEWRLAPGSATGHHTHEMDYVIVPVTSGEMTIVAPTGERTKAQLGVGKSYFRKAGVARPARELLNCHRSVAVDPSMCLKVPAIGGPRGVAGMLNYLKKFAVDIFPSVAATVIGAYIVNHYIVSKPATDAPAATASTANPKGEGKAEAKSDAKPAETTASVSNLPAAGVKAKGISEKAVMERTAAERPAVVEKAQGKTEAKTEAKAEAKAEAKTDEKVDAKADAKADAKSADAKSVDAKSTETKSEKIRVILPSPIQPSAAPVTAAAPAAPVAVAAPAAPV